MIPQYEPTGHHSLTRKAIRVGPHVFGAEDLPGARRDGPQYVNERLGLIAARLLAKDAGADGAYERGGFRESCISLRSWLRALASVPWWRD